MFDKFEGKGILFNDYPAQLHYEFDPTNLDLIEDYWEKFDGEFLDDNRHGRGVFYLTNGEKFEGYFVNDDANGEGKFTKNNGQIIKGFWKNNILV